MTSTATEHREDALTEIARLVETKAFTPNYSGQTFTEEEIRAGAHRRFVGGNYDSHGATQLRFLTEHGLRPEHCFLDVGCGSLRAGRHLVDYLQPGHYYGIDANVDLIQAGYDIEMSEEQRNRLPAGNLRANDRFNGDFGIQFDMAIAQSVFSHVSLNHVRLCLFRMATVIKPGGKFYATFYEQPRRTPVDKIIVNPQNPKPRLTERNVFWYYRADIAWAASIGPWKFRYIGDWGHPHGQKMAEFIRLDDSGRLGGLTDRLSPAVAQFTTRGRRWVARKIAP